MTRAALSGGSRKGVTFVNKKYGGCSFRLRRTFAVYGEQTRRHRENACNPEPSR
jgi:hypothetical protein